MTAMQEKIKKLREARAALAKKLSDADAMLSEIDSRLPLPEGVDDLVDEFIDLRDAKEASAALHKARDAGLTARMDAIEAELLKRMSEGGMQSVGTKRGTAMMQQKTSAKVGDWEEVLKYAVGGNLDLLGKHVSKEAVKAYMEANDGATPPGVEWFVTPSLSVRRK